MEQNDKLHKYSIDHNGEKCGDGAMEGFGIFYAEDSGKTYHVVGENITWEGEEYEYYQLWIPKSICKLHFHLHETESKVWIPTWAKVKFYHINRENAGKYRVSADKLRREA